MPIYKSENGDWIDIRVPDDILVFKSQYIEVPMGIAVKLPEGYEAIVAPRSSTFRKWGVLFANSIGIIDNSYCGDDDEWHCLLYGTRDTVIPKNTRIAQFRVLKNQKVSEVLISESLGEVNRGGLGSTGSL